MPPRSYVFHAPTNPLLQVLYFLVGGVLLIGALVIGAVVLSILVGIALIAGIVIYVRVWWLKRKLERSGRSGRGGGPGSRQSSRPDTIEVEYTVVEEREERKR